MKNRIEFNVSSHVIAASVHKKNIIGLRLKRGFIDIRRDENKDWIVRYIGMREKTDIYKNGNMHEIQEFIREMFDIELPHTLFYKAMNG